MAATAPLKEGMLDITVDRADTFVNIPKHSVTQAKPDALVVVAFGETIVHKTKYKSNTTTPAWNETCRVMVKGREKLTFYVYDHQLTAKNKLLGNCCIDPRSLERGEQEYTFDVMTESAETGGQVVPVCKLYLKLCPDPATLYPDQWDRAAAAQTFVPETPSPLIVVARAPAEPPRGADGADLEISPTGNVASPASGSQEFPGKLVRGDTTFSQYSDRVVYVADSDEDLAEEEDIVVSEEEERAEEQRGVTVLTPADMYDAQVKLINSVKDLFVIPGSTARLLLQAFNWNGLKLTEKFYESTPEKIYQMAKVADPRTLGQVTRDLSAPATCGVCFCEYPGDEMEGLACGHIFCRDCWGGYLRTMIVGEGMSTDIKCMAQGCPLLVDEGTVSRLISEPDVKKAYMKMVAMDFVKKSNNIRWCPAPGCENAIKVPVNMPQVVECACKHSFCFACGHAPHQPASCKMIGDWDAKAAAGTDEGSWFLLNTKPCPKCKVMINKDEGCQYMVCTQCQHHFCWLCMGNFDHVKHACNRYTPQDGDDLADTRNKLNKWLFFHGRHQAHHQSRELEKAIAQRVNVELHEMMRTTSAMHLQYMVDACRMLAAARETLKATYVYGYYLPAEVNRDLFEFLQSEVEGATEKLSQALDKKDQPRWEKPVIKVLADNLGTRLKNLIAGLDEGAFDGGNVKDKKKEKVYDGPAGAGYSGWIYEG